MNKYTHNPDLPVIKLYTKNIGVIIQHPSGVLFYNQTGGNACLRSYIEGVYLPLDWFNYKKIIFDYFNNSKHYGNCSYHGIDKEDADYIDDMLKSYLGNFLSVDRTMLKKSHDGWVYVIISKQLDPEQSEHLLGFDGKTGVLTWQ